MTPSTMMNDDSDWSYSLVGSTGAPGPSAGRSAILVSLTHRASGFCHDLTVSSVRISAARCIMDIEANIKI